jgi:hypothetical protein
MPFILTFPCRRFVLAMRDEHRAHQNELAIFVFGVTQFAFKPGRDAIQTHYQSIIDAGATSITLELKNLELRGNDGVWAAGTYSVTVKDDTTGATGLES